MSGPVLSPFWWEAAPRDLPSDPLPQTADVAVIGSGYTGLSAALRLAEGGVRVAVIDAGPLAAGASSRNFGLLGRQFVPHLADLAERLGLDRAVELYNLCNLAFAHVNRLIDRLDIDCDRRPAGRFIACATPRHLEAQKREHALRAEHLGHGYRVVEKADLGGEFGSPLYHGGIVVPEHLTLHPGKFSAGLARAVRAAGATLTGETPVTAIARDGAGFRLACGGTELRAAEIVIATNGYTGQLVPDLRRRIVPIQAYMIATEPLPPEVIRQALPTERAFHDTARDMIYGRPSPCGTRLLFGGATGERHDDIALAGEGLRRRLLRLFPHLPKDLALGHAWTGQCGGTFDHLPHRGQSGPLHYAMGYNFGAGMPLGTYLGDSLGRALLGETVELPLDALPMQTRPLYRGRPWFLPAYLAWGKLRDRLDGGRIAA
ncbi:NAD(P)/FAD-dependent oxidoreductase [Tabrizicola sp.]|uniref:NAD(P)/FAD-dependent oxidoreductase n=1 Tax=Tabrizicola sp. TaxID=2005166 RepID=UPI002FDDC5C5